MTQSASSSAPGPFSRFEFMVAGRYLRARRKDTFISVIAALTLTGIAIGVATLIVVMSVMNGFREDLLSKILGLNGHFSAYPIERQFTDYKNVVAAVESVEGVRFAITYAEGNALASGAAGSQSTGVIVRGLDFADVEKLQLLHEAAELGAWDNWDSAQGVAIGYRLAQRLGVSRGDPVTLVTPGGSTPQIRSYPVNIILNLGMVEFDSLFLYMPLEAAQDYFKLYSDVLKPGAEPPSPLATNEEIDAAYRRVYQASGVEIFIDEADNVAELRRRLQESAARPLILTDWQQRNETFFSALQVQRVVMFVILSMIILVAAFNIISSLIMLVKDKSKDIAVLRTMGATRSSIMRIFFMTGAAIGVAGTLVGLVFGLLVAANTEALSAFISDLIGVRIFPPEVFMLSRLPSQVNPGEVVAVVVLALALTFLATLYPAWRAAQYDPVEALRYE